MTVHSHRSGKSPLCSSLSGPLRLLVLTTPLLVLQDDPLFWSLYLEVVMAQGHSPQRYPPTQMVRGLSWLARTCTQLTISEIRVADMQPTWLATQHQQGLYQILVSLGGGTSFGFIMGLIGGISFGLAGDMLQGLIHGLLGGTIGGLLSGIIIGGVSRRVNGLTLGPLGTLDEILPLPMFRGSWQHLYRNIRRKLLRRLLLSLLMGLLFGLGKQPLYLLLWAIVSAVIFGVLDSLLLARLPSQGQTPSNPRRTIPTCFVYGTATICGVGLSGLLLLAFGQPVPWQKLPLIGLPIGLYFWFVFSGIIHLQRLILKTILCHCGKISWNMTEWLDEATALGILQHQGTHYHFTHPCLQDILAKA